MSLRGKVANICLMELHCEYAADKIISMVLDEAIEAVNGVEDVSLSGKGVEKFGGNYTVPSGCTATVTKISSDTVKSEAIKAIEALKK